MTSLATKKLTRAVWCDVLVVGAGISGAIIAEALNDAGLDDGIADRRGAVQGSAAASTTLQQYEFDTPLSVLSEGTGRQGCAG